MYYRYIYGGIISFNEPNVWNILKVLIAADQLLLQELVDCLQKYFIENQSEWMEQHFGLIYQAGFNLIIYQNFNNFVQA